MSEIIVSEIQIIPVKPQDGLVAFVSCVINNQFYIGDIAIHTSLTKPSGYRLVYPAKMLVNGKRVNTAYPINRKSGDVIEKAVIGKFEKLIEKVQWESKCKKEKYH